MIADRLLDDGYAPEVRQRVMLLTLARTVENSAFRYAPPFLATIASGLDVSLSTIGVALSITELGGLLSPALGRLVDGWPRRVSLIVSGAIVAAGALTAGLANGIVMFTIGLFVLALAKTVFDLSVNAWIAGHVEYERRARVVGIVETSWAGGLLLGVSILGLLTAVTSWRVAYAVAAAAMALATLALARRFPAESAGRLADRAAALPDHDGTAWRRLLFPILGFLTLMGAAQCAFVTFGSWLEDAHGFTASTLAAVTFVLGGFELVASTATMRLTDRFGKRRSVMYGCMIMAPAAAALGLGLHATLAPALIALAVLLLGFEFAIVSGLSLASNLVPGRPGSAIGIMFGAGTVGRGILALAATRLYEHHGMAAPMLVCSGLAVFALASFAASGHTK